VYVRVQHSGVKCEPIWCPEGGGVDVCCGGRVRMLYNCEAAVGGERRALSR